MRTSLGIILFGTACSLVVGCAQRDQAVSIPPTSDELPQIKSIQRHLPAIVIAENPRNDSRVRLVPSFKQPELTPEERAALGQEPLDFEFLLYEPFRPPGSLVGLWFGGVQTAIHGYGGASALYGLDTSVSRAASQGGVRTDVDLFDSRISGMFPRTDRVSTAGPRSEIVVETDSIASRIAKRRPRIE